MAKSFSLVEAISRLLYSALVEPIKIFFYFTSCQPNWSLISEVVFGVQAGEPTSIIISLINGNDLRESHPRESLDSIHIMSKINCLVIPKLSFVFFILCMVFFLMSCTMRFYMIVVRPLVDPQETLAKPTQITGFTLIGLLLSLQLTGWILATQIDGQNQPAFTLACEVPNLKIPSRSWTKSQYIYILSILYLAALTLSILMVYKVKKSTGATPDSQHFKLTVYTCFHVMGFALIAFATILVKSINSTNITRVSLILVYFLIVNTDFS